MDTKPSLVSKSSLFTLHYPGLVAPSVDSSLDIKPTMPNSNNTCGNTLDNDKAQSSVFVTTSFEDEPEQNDEPYETLAKSVTFIISRVYRNVNSTSESGTRFVCLKNSDFAEGSRKPGDPESAAPCKNIANMLGLVLVFLVTALSLLV
jgi:hypothetical protein